MVDYRNSDASMTPLADASDARDESVHVISRSDWSDDAILIRLKEDVLRMNPAQTLCAMTFADEVGVSYEALSDHYIPAVARDLGEAWCTDQLGFADVTIGSARLQAMLRDLARTWSITDASDSNTSTVLIVVPDGTHHTLGAMVLSGQLRRKGLSVRLLLGGNPENVTITCAFSSFDAIFLSAVRGESLESLRKIIEAVHSASENAPPVVIGGTLLDIEPDVAALTGADYVTSLADEAIDLCNLRTTRCAADAMDN